MGASGFGISFQPLQGADTTPLEELQPLIWNLLADYTWRYTSQFDSVWNGYLSEVSPYDDANWFDVNDQEMTFWFPDFAGCCGRSAGVGQHWIKAAYAACFNDVSSLAQDHGWLPSSDPPKLADEVWKKRSYAWIPLDDDIFEFSFEPDWDDDGIHGDDDWRKFSEMSDEWLDKVKAAVEGEGLCPCPMCVMLRPDPDFEAEMVESLASDNPDIAMSATWYLRQTAKVSVETALAVARNGHAAPRDHAAACHDFAQKISADEASAVLDALQAEDDELTRCGLFGLASGLRVEDDAVVQRRLFTFVSALAEGGTIRDVAAEYAGYGQVAAGHEDHFAKALVQHVGTSEEYDHNVALTLFNFYMSADAVPRFALEAIEKLVSHESEQVQVISAFAHQQLSSKPTR